MLTANGQVPHDEACRLLRTSTETPNCRHKQACNWRDSRRSLSSDLETNSKAVSRFLFSESGREECSCGRNDAPGLLVLGAKLRLHQVFWSQNLAFQSQNATMRPDFSSPEKALVRVVSHPVRAWTPNRASER